MSYRLQEILHPYKIILGSESPRREMLLKGLNIPFTIEKMNVDEVYPPELKKEEIAIYLAEIKADAYTFKLNENEILITADTIVWKNDRIWNKPKDRKEAIEMLKALSGDMHEVYTGVSLSKRGERISFFDLTRVYFTELSLEEIEYYVDNYKPFDKAGAYGAQDWLGYVAIEKLEGSFYNVMGLPVQKLYDNLFKIGIPDDNSGTLN